MLTIEKRAESGGQLIGWQVRMGETDSPSVTRIFKTRQDAFEWVWEQSSELAKRRIRRRLHDGPQTWVGLIMGRH